MNFAFYVEDVDAVFQQALQAGATVVRPVKDMFYGDRVGCLSDPFGSAGTFDYHCIPHASFMTGTVVVEEAVAKVQREPAPDPYTETWCALASKHLSDRHAEAC